MKWRDRRKLLKRENGEKRRKPLKRENVEKKNTEEENGERCSKERSHEGKKAEFKGASSIVTKEIIHAPQKNFMRICPVNTGSGTPYILALEFRPLRNLTYETRSGSLQLFGRLNVGSTSDETIM
ncbi:hypothetical protein WN943_003513 [Citrus x changshan-huyou]